MRKPEFNRMPPAAFVDSKIAQLLIERPVSAEAPSLARLERGERKSVDLHWPLAILMTLMLRAVVAGIQSLGMAMGLRPDSTSCICHGSDLRTLLLRSSGSRIPGMQKRTAPSTGHATLAPSDRGRGADRIEVSRRASVKNGKTQSTRMITRTLSWRAKLLQGGQGTDCD